MDRENKEKKMRKRRWVSARTAAFLSGMVLHKFSGRWYVVRRGKVPYK